MVFVFGGWFVGGFGSLWWLGGLCCVLGLGLFCVFGCWVLVVLLGTCCRGFVFCLCWGVWFFFRFDFGLLVLFLGYWFFGDVLAKIWLLVCFRYVWFFGFDGVIVVCWCLCLCCFFGFFCYGVWRGWCFLVVCGLCDVFGGLFLFGVC